METPHTIWQHDVFAAAKHSSQLHGELPIVLLTRLHSDLVHTDGMLNYQIDGIINEQGNLFLQIKIAGRLMVVCQRCLEPLEWIIDVDNTLQLVFSESELDSEEDEFNAIVAGSDAPEKIVGAKDFDILNLMEDEIILSLPLTLMHENCPVQLPSSCGQKVSAFDILQKLKQ